MIKKAKPFDKLPNSVINPNSEDFIYWGKDIIAERESYEQVIRKWMREVNDLKLARKSIADELEKLAPINFLIGGCECEDCEKVRSILKLAKELCE